MCDTASHSDCSLVLSGEFLDAARRAIRRLQQNYCTSSNSSIMYAICGILLAITIYCWIRFGLSCCDSILCCYCRYHVRRSKAQWFKLHVQYPHWRSTRENLPRVLLALLDRVFRINKLDYELKFKSAAIQTPYKVLAHRWYRVGTDHYNEYIHASPHSLNNERYDLTAAYVLKGLSMAREVNVQSMLQRTPHAYTDIVSIRYRINHNNTLKTCRHLYVLNSNTVSCFPPTRSIETPKVIIWDASLNNINVTDQMREWAGVHCNFSGMTVQQLLLGVAIENESDDYNKQLLTLDMS